MEAFPMQAREYGNSEMAALADIIPKACIWSDGHVCLTEAAKKDIAAHMPGCEDRKSWNNLYDNVRDALPKMGQCAAARLSHIFLTFLFHIPAKTAGANVAVALYEAIEARAHGWDMGFGSLGSTGGDWWSEKE